MLGYHKKELLTFTIYDLHPRRDLKFIRKDFERHARSDGAFSTDMPILKKDGNVFFADIASSSIIINREKYISAFFADITEHKKVEEALSLHEKKIRAIFDQTFQFIGMLTPDGRVLEANRSSMQFAGIKEFDCVGKFFWNTPWWTHSKEMQNKLRDAVARAALGEFVSFEATHIAADGSLHYIDFSLKPVKDENGRVIFLIPEGRDITERKRIEEELVKYRDNLKTILNERTLELGESEEKFKAIFTEATDGMILADASSRRFLMSNRAICQMLGYTEKEMSNLGVRDIHPAKELPHVMAVFKGFSTGVSNFVHDVAMRRKDGSIFYADISASIIFLRGRAHLLGSFRDVTKSRAIAAALKASEINYRTIFELASEAILIRDDNYKTVDANRAACEMFECSKNEILGMHIKEFMTNEPRHTFEDAKRFFEKAASGEPQLFEWPAVTKTGKRIWVEATIKRITVEGQYRLMSILRDITERKNLAILKDNFINSVSHELRTPLAAVKEGVSIVFEQIVGTVDDKNKRILGIVKKNVDRLNRLIDDVLDFQKIESHELMLNLSRHNINNVATECYKTMSVVAADKKLDFSLDLDKQIPKTLFDKDRIMQVFMNLVNNAIKFTIQGNVTIITRLEGRFLKVSVADTGIGIRTADLPKLFKKFGQLEGRAELKAGGTGLGLVISKGIIEKHGGKIWVESQWGKGSIFSFTIPFKK